MRKVLFVIVTILIGLPIQFFFSRYLNFFGVGPHILLLAVVAIGFIRGPMLGEVVGFSWGLIVDSIGVSMFGLNSLLLALGGYISGRLRRRIASERPQAQVVIGLVSTLLYGLFAAIIHLILEEGGERLILVNTVMACILSILVVTAVFWVMERWLRLWQLRQEQI